MFKYTQRNRLRIFVKLTGKWLIQSDFGSFNNNQKLISLIVESNSELHSNIMLLLLYSNINIT